ncbi:serine hydrolase domain-containing protein [Pseudoduganella sp. OTU4001]|uniref:serine hydrolase domain-containing protein n=1 Tax=Pseudoduganella sp. OTU4001 TaxID=3043854 RepID=UPI00313CE7EA
MIVENVLRPGFEALRDRFAAHFARDDEFRELGAALVVYRHGEKVVELYGGWQDDAASQPWGERTLTNIWSASKGVLALAIAQQVDTGVLDYDAPVARWWPEFAQAGKGSITLGQVMSHRAGLNGFSEPTTAQDLYDWELVTARLARQAPLWQPGSLVAYHGMTYGWLAGEVLRRATGLTPRDYIAAHIAAPLQADLALGVPAARAADVATIVPPQADGKAVELNSFAIHCVRNPVPDAAAANQPGWRSAQLPAVNVHASADGLARLYAALANGGRLDGATLLSPAGLARLVAPRGAAEDQMLGARQWAAGVALSLGGLYGPRADAFGHSGWGGSFGCADPASGRGIAYITRRMGSALNGDPRARGLVELATKM